MAVVVVRRGGTMRVSRRELASCALIGCLLPGANAVLFFAERDVPIGLASLLIASVPLLVVLLRLVAGERLAATALAGVGVGFVGVAVLPPAGRRDVDRGIAALPALGGDVGGRLVRLGRADDAGRPVHRDRVGDARRRLRDAAARHRDDRSARSRRRPRSILAWLYLVTIGSVVGYTA